MPIYEYHCLHCGGGFERLVYGPGEVACPQCGSARVGRKLSLFGVRPAPVGGSGARRGGGCGCGGGGCGCR